MVYENVRGFELGAGPPAYKTLLSTSPPLRAYQGLKLGIKTYLATWQLQAAYVFVQSFALEILSVVLALYCRDVYPQIKSRRREKMEIWTFIRLIAWDWCDRFSIQLYWMLYHASGRVKCILIIGNLNLQLLVYINSPVWVKLKVTRCQAIRQKKMHDHFLLWSFFFKSVIKSCFFEKGCWF